MRHPAGARLGGAAGGDGLQALPPPARRVARCERLPPCLDRSRGQKPFVSRRISWRPGSTEHHVEGRHARCSPSTLTVTPGGTESTRRRRGDRLHDEAEGRRRCRRPATSSAELRGGEAVGGHADRVCGRAGGSARDARRRSRTPRRPPTWSPPVGSVSMRRREATAAARWAARGGRSPFGSTASEAERRQGQQIQPPPTGTPRPRARRATARCGAACRWPGHGVDGSRGSRPRSHGEAAAVGEASSVGRRGDPGVGRQPGRDRRAASAGLVAEHLEVAQRRSPELQRGASGWLGKRIAGSLRARSGRCRRSRRAGRRPIGGAAAAASFTTR